MLVPKSNRSYFVANRVRSLRALILMLGLLAGTSASAATYTWTSGAGTLSISLGTNEDLTISEAAGTRSFTIDTGTFAQSGGSAATGSGTATISFAAGDNIGASITVNNTGAGAGTNNVTFSAGTINSSTMSLRIGQAGTTGSITATAGSITSNTLTLETDANGVATIRDAGHDILNVRTAGGGVGSGGLDFRQSNAGGLTAGPITCGGTISLNNNGGGITLTIAADITAANGNINITAGGAGGNIVVIARLAAVGGTGNVALVGNSGISQANSNAGITALALRAESSNGNVILAPNVEANNAGTVAGFSNTGSFAYRSTGTFNVGLVNVTPGINAATLVSLQVNNVGGTITQTAGANGAIITPTLNLTTNNSNVTLTSVNNDIGALGTVNLGNGALTFATARAGGFSASAVTANGGIDITNTTGNLTTTAAVTSNGNISLRSQTGTLTVGNTVTSNNNGITLRSSAALSSGSFLVSAPTAVTGDITLISDTSTVTVGGGGVNVGDTLTIQVGPAVTLSITGPVSAPSVALHADQMTITAAVNAGNTITLAPVTAGTTMTVGNHGSPVGLIVDNTELGFLTSASALTVGRQSTGTITAGAVQFGTATVGNATLNVVPNNGVTQSGVLNVGGGGGTLNITAGGTVALGSFASGVVIGQVSGSTTSGDFMITANSGVSNLAALGITTAGGQITLINTSSNGNISVNGALTSNGGNILAATVTGTASTALNADVLAGTGGLALQAGSGGFSQSAGRITANNMAALSNSGGTITLNSATNAVTGNVSIFTNGAGNVGFTNTSAFIVGGLNSIPFNLLSFGMTPGLRTDAAGAVTLTAGGTVTQAGTGGTDIVTTGTLNIARVGAANPSVTLGNTSNAVTNVGSVNLGAGSLTLADAGGLTITGSATTNSYSLQSTGSITQGGGTTIAASSVNAVSTGGSVSLVGSATNAFATITGSAAGIFSATTTQSMTVGATGVSAGFGLTLTASGGGSNLAVNNLVNGNASFVILNAGLNITQAAAGGVTAASLQANATAGAVNLTAGAANNNVATLAGQSNGNFSYTETNASGLTIGTVSTSGIVSTAGDIDVRATGGLLTVSQNVTASAAGGDVTLLSSGDLTSNGSAIITGNATNGIVSLRSTASSIIETGSSNIRAAQLEASAQTNVDLTQSANMVGAAGIAINATTGFVAFFNAGAIELDQVGILNGITAAGPVVLATTAPGNITQTATGIINTGGGLLLQALNGSIVFDQPNQVAGNFVVVFTNNGDITLRNAGNLNIGTVGPLATQSPISASSGIASASNRSVSLTSDTGTITQGGAIGERIFTGQLQLNTTNRNVTLTNTSNAITAIGSSNLGTGQLSVFDGDAGLDVTNPIVADGGVILTTQTTFNLPGSITVANGNISLTSTSGSISLTSTLSAVLGQVQLDVRAAGQTITQTGAGTVTANGLIARAGGNVTLTGTNNDVTTIAGSSTTGTFSYRDSTAVAIGSLTDSTAVVVNGLTTTNQDIIVVAGAGGVAGGIAVNQPVNGGTAIVRLQTARGDISQAAAGLVTANSTLLNATMGSVNLAAAANPVTFVAGTAGGSFRVQTASLLGVSSVAADGGALTTAATGITSIGDVALQTPGALGLLAGINAGLGTVRLRTTGGGIVGQVAGGEIIADALLIDATGAVTLYTCPSNDVNTLAGRTTIGEFRFLDADGFNVDTVTADGLGLGPVLPIGPLSGVVTANADITLMAVGPLTLNQAVNAGTGTARLESAGALTQSGAGVITAATLGVRNDSATAGNITLNLLNELGTVAAVNAAPGGTIVIRDGDLLTDKLTVGSVTADGPFDAINGITTNNGDVTLQTDNGPIDVDQPINAGTGTVTLIPIAPEITLNPPAVFAGSTGNQASGPAGLTTYAWVIVNGVITSGANAQTVTYSIPAGTTGMLTLTLVVSAPTYSSSINSVTIPIDQPAAIVSGPTATPNPALVAQPVGFSVTATDAESDPLTFTWNFGDGTTGTGASIQHIYAAPGTYAVTLAIFDGLATTSANLTVVVSAGQSIIGIGPDSDGDGFGDNFETGVDTNPGDIGNTPDNVGVLKPEMVVPMNLYKTSIKLNFKKSGKDMISFTAFVSYPETFPRPAVLLNGARVLVDVSGVTRPINLDAQGFSKTKEAVFKHGPINPVKNSVKMTVTLARGDFKQALAAVGLTDSDAKKKPVTPTFSLIFKQIVLQATPTLKYSAKTGQSGSAK